MTTLRIESRTEPDTALGAGSAGSWRGSGFGVSVEPT
jgi:hypothetical protein